MKLLVVRCIAISNSFMAVVSVCLIGQGSGHRGETVASGHCYIWGHQYWDFRGHCLQGYSQGPHQESGLWISSCHSSSQTPSITLPYRFCLHVKPIKTPSVSLRMTRCLGESVPELISLTKSCYSGRRTQSPKWRCWRVTMSSSIYPLTVGTNWRERQISTFSLTPSISQRRPVKWCDYRTLSLWLLARLFYFVLMLALSLSLFFCAGCDSCHAGWFWIHQMCGPWCPNVLPFQRGSRR